MKQTTGIMARAAMRARTDMAVRRRRGMMRRRPRVTVVKMRANMGSPLPGADRSARQPAGFGLWRHRAISRAPDASNPKYVKTWQKYLQSPGRIPSEGCSLTEPLAINLGKRSAAVGFAFVRRTHMLHCDRRRRGGGADGTGGAPDGSGA